MRPKACIKASASSRSGSSPFIYGSFWTSSQAASAAGYRDSRCCRIVFLIRPQISKDPTQRSHHQGSFGAPSEITTTVSDKQGTRTASKAAQVVQSAPKNQTFWLSNNLPYAERLEFGWSDQAPEGMVRTNVARFQRILEEEANKNKI